MKSSYKIIKKRSALLLHCSAPCSGLIWRYIESALGCGEAYLSRLFGFSFFRPPLSFPFCAGLECWFQPHAGRFVAHSVFTCDGIPSVPFSTFKRISPPPLARRIPMPATAPTPHRWTTVHKCVHICKRIGQTYRTHTRTHIRKPPSIVTLP